MTLPYVSPAYLPHGCGFTRWHNPQHEGRNLFPGVKRTGNPMADRVQALEERRNRQGVIGRELPIRVPGHDRRQRSGRPAACRSGSPSRSAPGVHWPMPVSLSGVMLGPTKTPRPGISKPTSEPPRKRDGSGRPKKYPGVWQSLQPLIVTRYLPRAIWRSSAMAVNAGSVTSDAIQEGKMSCYRQHRFLPLALRGLFLILRTFEARAFVTWPGCVHYACGQLEPAQPKRTVFSILDGR